MERNHEQMYEDWDQDDLDQFIYMDSDKTFEYRYYYAGISAHFMFGCLINVDGGVKDQLTKQIDSIKLSDLFDTPHTNSHPDSNNTLVCFTGYIQNADSKLMNYDIVSRYTLSLVLKKLKKEEYVHILTKCHDFATLQIKNPSFAGWVFENIVTELIQCWIGQRTDKTKSTKVVFLNFGKLQPCCTHHPRKKNPKKEDQEKVMLELDDLDEASHHDSKFSKIGHNTSKGISLFPCEVQPASIWLCPLQTWDH